MIYHNDFPSCYSDNIYLFKDVGTLSISEDEVELVKVDKSPQLRYFPCCKHRLRLITPVVSGGWRSAVKMRRVADCGGDPP